MSKNPERDDADDSENEVYSALPDGELIDLNPDVELADVLALGELEFTGAALDRFADDVADVIRGDEV